MHDAKEPNHLSISSLQCGLGLDLVFEETSWSSYRVTQRVRNLKGHWNMLGQVWAWRSEAYHKYMPHVERSSAVQVALRALAISICSSGMERQPISTNNKQNNQWLKRRLDFHLFLLCNPSLGCVLFTPYHIVYIWSVSVNSGHLLRKKRILNGKSRPVILRGTTWYSILRSASVPKASAPWWACTILQHLPTARPTLWCTLQSASERELYKELTPISVLKVSI